MKKLLLTASLLICPMVLTFGQLSISGLAGKDGYSVLRASADLSVMPGLSITPKYSVYERDSMSTMSQYGLGAALRLPFIDIVQVGADGFYTPKANSYSNYGYDLNAAVNIENLLFRILPTDELKVGAGFRSTRHSFYDPDSNNTQNDAYGFLYQKTGGLDTALNYTKAISYSKSTQGSSPEWLDVPYFTAVYNGYLDYSLGATVGYTYKIVRPYVAYNYLKLKNGEGGTDDAKLGITVAVLMVNVNASVEWLNFSQNTGDRHTFYSLSAGVKFL